jgi:phage terminase large subunit-like protein
MESFGQGFASMSAPTKELERMVLDKKINHAGNPILRWMCGNLQMKLDPSGNIKMDKAKSKEKIDGMVALAMAIGSYMSREEDGESNYEDRGMLWI